MVVSISPSAAGGAYLDASPYSRFERLFQNELYNKYFDRLPRKDFWKLLFMERHKIQEGKEAYEKEEPGYLEGMYRGYQFMLETLDQPLTPALFCKLHDMTTEGTYSEEVGDRIPSGFRRWEDQAEAFQVVLGETLSEEGYKELLGRVKKYEYIDEHTSDKFLFLQDAMVDPRKTIDCTGASRSFIQLKPTRPETAAANVDACIGYYRNRPKCSSDEIVSAIARLCQDLDQLHVFVDGNIRTTAILLLNRELLIHGESPCVLEDVNCIDCLSEAEIVEKVREGQQFFQRLLRH